MGALDTLRRWLAPILNPFSELPRHLTTIQQNHQSTLNSFETLMAGLVTFPPSDQQFAGPAADDAIQFVEEYLRAEHSISAPEGILDQISTATATCADDVEIATENLASAAEDDSVLFEVTEAVDIVDVAQGGLDPVTDIPGIILTIVSAAAIIGALTAFGWAIYDAVQTWIKAMNRAASTPYPHPPKMGTGQTPRNSLTEEQENLAKKLHADYGHLGLSLDDIRAIMAQNPHLTEAQLRELLSKYGSVIKNYPKLVKAHGALTVFQAFIALAAYDPAHGGNYSTRKPAVLDDYKPGIEEAEAELGAMEEGLAPWPFTPSLHPSYEATDANGQKWDVKSYRSIDSNGKPFNPDEAVKRVKREVNRGEKVILDDRKLTQEEIDALHEGLKKAKLDNEVVWWPTTPTELTPPPPPTPDATATATP